MPKLIGLIATLATAVALSTLTTGCGSSSSVTGALDPVAQAADKTSAAHSFKLALTGGVVVPGRGPVTFRGAGAFDVSRRIGTLDLQLPGGAGANNGAHRTIRELIIGTVLYLRFPAGVPGLPAGKSWLKIDIQRALASRGINVNQLSGLGSQNDPSQLLNYLRGSGHVTKLGRASIRGVPTTHYRSTIDLSKVAQRVPAAKASIQQLEQLSGVHTIPMQVWIDANGRVRRESLSYASRAAGSTLQTTVTIDLFGFGTPVHVTAPPASQVVDVTGAAQGATGPTH